MFNMHTKIAVFALIPKGQYSDEAVFMANEREYSIFIHVYTELCAYQVYYCKIKQSVQINSPPFLLLLCRVALVVCPRRTTLYQLFNIVLQALQAFGRLKHEMQATVNGERRYDVR